MVIFPAEKAEGPEPEVSVCSQEAESHPPCTPHPTDHALASPVLLTPHHGD